MQVSKEFVQSEVERLRRNFSTKKTLSYEWRRKQLERIIQMCREKREEIKAALNKDLGVPGELANLMEIGATIQETQIAIQNLKNWMAPEKKSVPVVVFPSQGYVYKQPYGVVCIISPWNYPFRLMMFPLIGAIAAGNAVLLKPSELSSNVSSVIGRLVREYLDQDFLSVIEGDATISTYVLSCRFDYIFYTGNSQVGKIVMRSASENLTPVTLELGGKSPVIVDKTSKIPIVVNRVISGKLQNVGQTCVAPDYLLVDNKIKDKLIAEMKSTIDEWYLKKPEEVEYYSKIINERHTRRLQSYLEEVKDKIVHGGLVIPEKRFVSPTLVDTPPENSRLMKEEIFGPILPIIGYDKLEEALERINKGEKPLALYVFSQDEKVIDKVLTETSSGGVCVNGTILHIACPEIGFGGVGESGMGSYNGRNTFDTFSHKRGVLKRSTLVDPTVGYPPFTKDKLKLVDSIADGVTVPTPVKVAGVASSILAAGYLLSKL